MKINNIGKYMLSEWVSKIQKVLDFTKKALIKKFRSFTINACIAMPFFWIRAVVSISSVFVARFLTFL